METAQTRKKRWHLALISEEGGAWRDYTTSQAVPVVPGTPTFFFAHANLNPLTTTLSSTKF